MATPTHTNTTKRTSRLVRPRLITHDDRERERLYEEYGILDLNCMKKEEIDRVVGFISAKPEERKIRNSNVQSVPELRNLAYQWLNELLCLLESSNTIMVYKCKRLQDLVTKLKGVSFEGSWLDEVQKFSRTLETQFLAQEEHQKSSFESVILFQRANDKKKHAEEKLVEVMQRKQEVSDNLNNLKQNFFV